MVAFSIPPVEQAKSIFTDLGYDVSGDGPSFRAERDWKVVHVTATTTSDRPPELDPGQLHCLVTDREHGPVLRNRLRDADPDCEWAIIAVDGGDEYDVISAPASGR